MMIKRIVWFVLLLCFLSFRVEAADPWAALQQQVQLAEVENKSDPPTEEHADNVDPWQQLQAIFLTFSAQQEQDALRDNEARKHVHSELHKALKPYQVLIDAASHRFNIPREIIAAVIMVESGGHRTAAAPSSSAKGLMQTIDSTFKQARIGLKKLGITIENDPFTPHSSIMAGCWYLDKMFQQTVRDGWQVGQRHTLYAWKNATEYYYAGPGHGRKKSDVVIIYSAGKRVVIDKPLYSKKVLQWAEIMRSES